MIGTTLAHYEIRERLGHGGMGEVFRALDTRLGREVAVKLIPPEVASDPERIARFEREARALAALKHPNIATIHGFEEEAGGRRFLVMELVEGESLAERIARGPLPLDELLPIAIQIAGGLAAAHVKGIVHRDLEAYDLYLRGRAERPAGASRSSSGTSGTAPPTLARTTSARAATPPSATGSSRSGGRARRSRSRPATAGRSTTWRATSSTRA